jgi:hypothetical protein
VIDHILKSIDNAQQGISKLNNDILSMEGMSGIKTRHFLNNIVDTDNVSYLEIGSWKGSTLCSALYGNNPKSVIAIDNFSEFNGPREEFYSNISILKNQNISFYDVDCFKFDKTLLLDKINIYFYDGNHSTESHELALSYFYSSLSDSFIYICDDWNWDYVQEGTKRAIDSLSLNVIQDWSYFSDYTGDATNWWNGLYIAYIKK